MWVDGIVFCSARLSDDRLGELLARRQPVVLVNHEFMDTAIGCVRLDEVCSAMILTNHLLSRGRRNLAMLAGKLGGPAQRARLAGFQAAMDAADLPVDDYQIKYCSTNPEGGYNSTIELLEQTNRAIDGIVCFNDMVAIGAMRAISERGLNVPNDINVVAFGDTILSAMVQPSLTALHRPIRELGTRAVQMLLQHELGNDYEREIVLESEIVIRESAP